MKNKKILITGSSGFIGTNLTQKLREQDHDVIGIDLVEPRFFPPNKFFQMDIRNQEEVKKIILEVLPDFVIHLAAVSTIQQGAFDENYTWQVNLTGTNALLSAIAESKCMPLIIHVSTDKVYGALGEEERYQETMELQPLKDSPYDESKAEADKLAQFFSSRLPIVIVRLCNIYGPYDLHMERVIPGNISKMLMGQNGILNCYEVNGIQKNFYREMLFIEDLCIGFSKLMSAFDKNREAFRGEVFNLGAQSCYSMEEILCEIQKTVCSDTGITRRMVENTHELQRQSLDDSKADVWFGYTPDTKLSDGIAQTVEWWREFHLNGGKIYE